MANMIHSPRIVQFAGGKARSTVTRVALHGAAMYYGTFVADITGADATPAGSEAGVTQFADDAKILGIAVGFVGQKGLRPLQDSSDYKGTFTLGTGQIPDKYTFSAANDRVASATPDLEMVEIMPIEPGDILEVCLWGASTLPVVRGTTTATGTTTSSGNIGVSMAVDTTYTFALTESSAAKNMANLDFITVDYLGKFPTNPYNVYVKCVRKSDSVTNAE